MKNKKSFNRTKVDNSRKAIRKQKRLQKKQHKQEHYMKKTKHAPKKQEYTAGRFVKRPAEDEEPDVEVKKKKVKPQPSLQEIVKKERQKEIKESNKLKSAMEEQRRKMLVKANEDEDKIIKKLEKQLGLNKSKNKNNYFANDGLDYLLEICDKKTTEQIVAAEKHLAEVEGDSDFEEDLAAVTGKDIAKKTRKKTKEITTDNIKSEGKSENETESDANDEIDESEEDEEFNDEIDNENDQIDSETDIGEENAEANEEIDDDDEHGADINAFNTDSESDAPEEKPIKSKKSKPTKQPVIAEKPKTKEKIIKEDELSKVFSDDEISHLSGDEDDFGEENDEFPHDDNSHELGNEKTEEKPDVWEDIYGRKRDKEGNVIKEEKGVYIPPHLRNKDSSSDKQLEQLKRQVKSILNKLTGTNLHWACNSVEALYSQNSRNAVNTSLFGVWSDACVNVAATPPRMLLEHAALLAVLHANVGAEIGAHFLQELCKQYDELVQTPQPISDKRLDNLISCLANLYGFKIYHAALMYDILNRLVERLSEKHIECVVVALRNVGGVLRKEEPLRLRQFIHDTQQRLATLNDTTADGSRIKFLLEVLMAVKNNNLSKIPNYDPSYLEQLRKATRGVVRRGNYVTTMNISLMDLLKAEERGKWWIVGSAWEGSNIQPQPQAQTNTQPTYDQKLLELARKMRMNTDVRRSIFCVIMSAEDCLAGFEALQALALRGPQQREAAHVLLACCCGEARYNLYYGLLAQKLCDYDRKYQLSFQFSVWDKLKEIENQSKQCLTNLAQFLVHLFMEKGLPLSVLKVIQFSELNKHSVKFMRQVLLSIIMNDDLQSSLEVFHRISKSPKLHMFRESLKLFIQHFLLKNTGKKNSVLSESDMDVLKERTVEVNKILTMYDSKLKL